VPVSSSSITWYRSKGGDAPRLGRLIIIIIIIIYVNVNVNVNVNEQFLSPRESCNRVTTAAT